jgi:hypothetical protein
MLMDLFRLPFARLLALSGTQAGNLKETPWIGYDTFVGAVSDSINAFYSNAFVSEMINQSFAGFLQLQRFNRALAGAALAGLVPATGMPTSKEVSEVRKELAELRSEIRSGQTVVGRRDLHLSLDREGNVESAPATRNPQRNRTPAAA